MAQPINNVGQNEYLPYKPIQMYQAPTGQDYAEVGHVAVDLVTNNAYIAGTQINGLQTWIPYGGAAVGVLLNTLTINPGDLIVTAGDLVVSNGDITATVGNLVATTGFIVATNSDIIAAIGNIFATAGNIYATAGAIYTTAGDIYATAGDIYATAGDITAVAGDIEATAGDIEATGGDFILGDATKGVTMGSTARILSGAGDPDTVLVAAKGSIFLRTDGASADEVLYVNTDGVSAWTPLIS